MGNENNALLTSMAREIGHRIRLAHHVPGRVRIKFDPSLARHPQREALENWLPELHAFSLLDFSPWSTSALIGYDASTIPPRLVDELFSSPDLERKKSILNQIRSRVG
jgi:hypothetical protein